MDRNNVASNLATLCFESEQDSISDEAALVHAAQEDPTAFDVLYHRYRQRIYAYLRARTSDAEDAADLTQHVFLQALDALPRYRVRRVPFAAWLFRIARNAATDFHRRRRTTVTWDLLPEALQPLTDDDAEAGVLRQEDMARLRALLRTLDQETRDVLMLRFTGHLTIAEIAAVIGKSEAATQKKLFRTIQTLQEHYHERM